MTIISRKLAEATRDPETARMLRQERHHGHKIVMDEKGRLFWKENPEVSKSVNLMGLNNIRDLYASMGFDKNSEIVRHMYRCMGYSLFGYWEIFYWDMNNPHFAAYKPDPNFYKNLNKQNKK